MQKIQIFSVLCLTAIGLCGGVLYAKEYPASDCGADQIGHFASCCGKKLPISKSWCEGSEIETSVVNSGQTRWARNTRLTENCTDACGNAEAVQPNPITPAISISVAYTDSVKETVGGSVSGGTFLAGIKAELKAEAETQDGHDATFKDTVSVTLPPCTWQKIYAEQQVVEGQQIRSSGTMQAFATFTCPHGTYVIKSPPMNYSATVNVDKALDGSGTSGTDSNGTCPPEDY